jgi:hypothetical protein
MCFTSVVSYVKLFFMVGITVAQRELADTQKRRGLVERMRAHAVAAAATN